METIIVFAPIVGAILCGFGWRVIGEQAAVWTATGLLFLAAALSWVVFLTHDGVTETTVLLRWIESGTLSTEWAIRMDRLTAIMLVVICSVSALVHLYSVGYMAHDDNWKRGEHYKARFFAYLSFFTFAMLMLVTADNLVQMFFGWEGVGVASYLLIGFYYRKASANAAAMKAFIVNRVGDFGFSLGMFFLYILTDSIHFDVIFAEAPRLAETGFYLLGVEWNAANLIMICLFIGAMGKSAQLILHTWLPDAMEGPTPVSALIHAATMVTAGVFLLCRMSPLAEYAPEAMQFVVFLGALTAFYAATVGLVQNDIKRVIAYSTCSQLGYMFVAAGVGVYSVAMFHLFTHAFFKALLFLGAGSVIHATHHEQDLRNFGGLRKHIPKTYWAMVIGTLAITGVGIPFSYDLLGVPLGFAGFQSKDAIIESAFVAAPGAALVLVLAAGMTSFYSWRLIFMTFHGTPRGAGHGHDAHGHDTHGHDTHGHDAHGHDAHGHGDHTPHESPSVMLVPLGILSVGAVFAGMIWYGVFFGSEDKVRTWFGMPAAHHAVEGEHAEAESHGGAAAPEAAAPEAAGHADAVLMAPQGAIYIAPGNTVLHDAHYVPWWVKLAPFLAMLTGLFTAWLFYIRKPDLPGRLAHSQRPLYLFLLNKWYFDEIYDFLIVRPSLRLASLLWKQGDGKVIDGAINGLAMGIIPALTRAAGRLQSGYMFTYALTMVMGIVALVFWVVLSGGAN